MTSIEPWTHGSIVRTWKGWIRSADRPRYAEYLEQTGLREYRKTPGNLGAFVMWRASEDGTDTDGATGDRTEVTTVSYWTNRESIVAFAGDDISVAVFYPEDDDYLIERDTVTRHYELGSTGEPVAPA